MRSGGHNHEGYSTGSGAILIDVSEMKNFKLDKMTHIATIGPGLNNRELYSRLFKEGLTHVGGTCADVGLSGLVLSGGMGPLLRKVGLTCDSLISFEMVDAKGQVLEANRTNEHKDLFWAACGGGGGNFGIITSMKIKVFPAADVTWVNIGWDWDQPIDQVITAWQEFFSRQDRNWFSHLDLWSKNFPSDDLNKKPVKVLGMFWGTPQRAREQLAPLLKIGTPVIDKLELVGWDKAIQLMKIQQLFFSRTNRNTNPQEPLFSISCLPKQLGSSRAP